MGHFFFLPLTRLNAFQGLIWPRSHLLSAHRWILVLNSLDSITKHIFKELLEQQMTRSAALCPRQANNTSALNTDLIMAVKRCINSWQNSSKANIKMHPRPTHGYKQRYSVYIAYIPTFLEALDVINWWSDETKCSKKWMKILNEILNEIYIRNIIRNIKQNILNEILNEKIKYH